MRSEEIPGPWMPSQNSFRHGVLLLAKLEQRISPFAFGLGLIFVRSRKSSLHSESRKREWVVCPVGWLSQLHGAYVTHWVREERWRFLRGFEIDSEPYQLGKGMSVTRVPLCGLGDEIAPHKHLTRPYFQ